MVIRNVSEFFGRIFFQRCFYLFIVLMLFICAAPFVEPTPIGRFAINCANAFIIIAAVASVGRSTLSFTIAVLLGMPALAYQWIAIAGTDPHAMAKSWAFGALLYATTIAYLLRYVFRREVMTADKLFGAASAYLLIAVFWSFLYALIAYFYAGSFALFGNAASLTFYDLVYFSFTVLTSTGFGDITPLSRQARGVCVVEQIVGALFVAILIARLAGVYPPREELGKS
ncbi:voltage-gated potassium channel [Burkholderia sp. SRS-W-2-2016]|uniref:potassium channel family protein n=1 Tax=Burkholderia sp. SRS-W-2-2016 TaxID=1926878 RepID=UPI00094AF7EE|nr:potassium channel family protein [Burkholderia sp. SRS-W-2-2016]OLL27993.1 voltage-gated potassium channel [Burkholderia sp. SRS-W-2-2016]